MAINTKSFSYIHQEVKTSKLQSTKISRKPICKKNTLRNMYIHVYYVYDVNTWAEK